MTCFWDGILRKLKQDDLRVMFNIQKRPNRIQLIILLKKFNRICENVKWMNRTLSKKEKVENYVAVKDYNIKKINNGHLCSSCDYFLILLCELCQVNILHIYNKNNIVYTNTKNARKLLTFHSNKRHFW